MALRLVEIILPEEHEGQVAERVENLETLGLWEQPLREGLILVRVLVDSGQAESVINEIERHFSIRERFRMWLVSVEATVPRVEEVEKQQTGEEAVEAEAREEEHPPQRVACMELVAKLSDGVNVSRSFVLTVILSTVLAGAGLIRDSVAVIIGAMVIAPLLHPNMALALATTLGERKLERRALSALGIGLLISLGIAVAAGLLIPVDPTVHEISSRAVVSVGDIILALAAGSAGALAFTSGVPAALVGVMVAVALLPPLVTAGLLLGIGEFGMALRAALLLATNVICVNLAGVATFLVQGVQPRAWWDRDRARRMVVRSVTIWVALLICLIALIYASSRW